MKVRKAVAAFCGLAGMAALFAAPVQAAPGDPTIQTNYWICPSQEANLGGYTYIKNQGNGSVSIGYCFANAGAVDMNFGGLEWRSNNNSGRINYTRPGIVSGSVTFGKWQSGGFDPGTVVTKVTLW